MGVCCNVTNVEKLRGYGYILEGNVQTAGVMFCHAKTGANTDSETLNRTKSVKTISGSRG